LLALVVVVLLLLLVPALAELTCRRRSRGCRDDDDKCFSSGRCLWLRSGLSPPKDAVEEDDDEADEAEDDDEDPDPRRSPLRGVPDDAR
jgi:hypothetical protein